MLSKEQLNRYHRHLLLPEVGLDGQEKLLAARVLVVGLGGLGCPAALYLAAAGIGHLGLVDFDRVDESNLQRQVLYTDEDVGRIKVEAAAQRLVALNPDVQIEAFHERLTDENAERIFTHYDYVLDGTDNFATRYLVNDACVLFGKINVYGSLFRFEGQVSVFAHPAGPCYRCLFPVPPNPGEVPNCAEAGVLGVLPGQIGATQATEVLKLILGMGEPLVNRLLLFDSLAMEWRSMRVARNSACPVCGDLPTITGLVDYDEFCGNLMEPGGFVEMTAEEILQLMETRNDLLLLDVREEVETKAVPGLGKSTLIPLGQLPARLGELVAFRDKTIVAYCAAGIRSRKALEILDQNGFSKGINMTGGINRYHGNLQRERSRGK